MRRKIFTYRLWSHFWLQKPLLLPWLCVNQSVLRWRKMPLVGLPFGSLLASTNSMPASCPPLVARKSSFSIVIPLSKHASSMNPHE